MGRPTSVAVMGHTTPVEVAEALPILPVDTELVTPEKLAAAEKAAHLAAGKLAAEERRSVSSQDLADLALKARRAEIEFTRLRDARAAQDRVLAERSRVETEAGPVVAEMAGRLEASRAEVVSAVVEAEQALRQLVEATEAHGAAVRQASAELIGRGLAAADMFGEQDTGGTVDGKGVRLAGEWWAAVDGSGLLCRSVAVVAEWAWGEKHPAVGLRRDFRTHSAVQRAASILKDVPALLPRESKVG
jgi:hypothetical protein